MRAALQDSCLHSETGYLQVYYVCIYYSALQNTEYRIHRREQTTLEISALGLLRTSGITTIAGYLT